jgi:putative nucleotidyltransferase with HDIG domain
MKLRPIHIYVATYVVLALIALVGQEWAAILPRDQGSLAGAFDPITGFLVLLLLGFFSESLTLPISIGKKAGSTSSIIFLPLLASLLLFGSAPTVLFMTITGVAGEFIIRKKEPLRASFNSAQYVLATAVGGWVFSALGGQALAFQVSADVIGWRVQILAFVGFGVSFVVLNNAAVTGAIALSEGMALRKVWYQIVGRSGTNLLYDILVSPIAIAVAFLYVELKALGLLVVILPLLFIRHAYLTIVQLQRANRDLLKALVKAIETRDPYTSGHSLRVASLAVRIADALGFSPKKQKDVETAALLHDIGKIEAVYTEILGKPSSLTNTERKVIESHVTKGVELLEELSSFPVEVIDAVRGHHERVDGKGYPHQLKGEDIPPAARIINVCDAIDAMLSDRPYRKALTLDAVREQLLIYGGKQFDLEVVNAAIQENVLEAHKAEIELLKREGTAPEYSSDRDGQQEQRVARKQEIMKKQGTK